MGKIIVSGIVLGILVRYIDLQQTFRALTMYSWKTLVLVLVITLLSGVLAAVKWHLLLDEIPLSTILVITFIQYFYALILFGQVTGDLARVYKLHATRSHPAAHLAATVMLDRTTGVISVFLLGIVGLMFADVNVPPFLIVAIASVPLLCFAGFLALRVETVYACIAQQFSTVSTTLRIPEMLSTHVHTFFRTIHTYAQKPMRLFISVVYGLIFQFLCILAIMLLARELSITISFRHWCWIFGAITILQFLPISISGLGIREGGFVGILGSFGVARETALALSLSIFGLQLFLGLIGGLLELKEHLRG